MGQFFTIVEGDDYETTVAGIELGGPLITSYQINSSSEGPAPFGRGAWETVSPISTSRSADADGIDHTTTEDADDNQAEGAGPVGLDSADTIVFATVDAAAAEGLGNDIAPGEDDSDLLMETGPAPLELATEPGYEAAPDEVWIDGRIITDAELPL